MRITNLCLQLSRMLPIVLVGLLCATLFAAERPAVSMAGLPSHREAFISDTTDSPQLTAKDSLPAIPANSPDTTLIDSIPADTLAVAVQDSVFDDEFELEDIVEYEAQDSIVLLGQNRAYLFGKSYVSYQQSRLEANFMYLNTDSSTVYTHYVLDSVGYPTAFPKFKDGEQSFEAKSFTYNFRSEKGIIDGVITQQGEGYLTAEKTKKMKDNIMFMQGGRYTTCDHHDHPHFYINLSKAKVHPEKDIVTGPVNLVIADMPLPIGLPFGYFPFSSKYSS
ncbi:putative LPS assembly protein LptD, partial [Porphyromonas loveana]